MYFDEIFEKMLNFVAGINSSGKDLTVEFPQQSHWTGLVSEMELVPSSHPGIT